MNRISSGIQGLDKILGGGIPENCMVLLSGPCGTGKTIFGLQFLCSAEEPGIFVTFEEEAERLSALAYSFGWDIRRLEVKKRLRMLKYDPYKFEDVMDILENNIKEMAARRIVVDPISALGIYMHDVSEFRRVILQMGKILRENRCTSLLISEITQPGTFSRFGVEEFVCDGVIVMDKTFVKDEYKKKISVIKLKSSSHSEAAHTYSITKKGITIQ